MRYLADTVYLIDLVNRDDGAVAFAKELDEIGEPVGLSTISAEEYFRGIFYLYWDDERVLKAKLADARRDLSTFEILPITYDIAVKAAEVEVATVKN
ncbi:MAG: PIN domain-containing protein [Candidatus Bathyarchaeia archaeon]